MRHLTIPLLVMAGLAVCGSNRAADIYCDDQGRDCSDRPHPGAIYMGSTSSAVPAASAPVAAPAGPDNGQPVDAAANARLGADAARQAVQKDVAASRATQCKDAKEKYQKSIEARRLYRMNKDGEREYFSDTETEQARLNARLEMERSCGSSTS